MARNARIPERIRQKQKELADFRNFLWLVWKHLNLPEPTELQYEVAGFLQDFGEPDEYGRYNIRKIVEAFRGMGKSWITAAFVLWLLFQDPQIKIMVVSASSQRAANFTQFCLKLIREMEELRWLEPELNQRQSTEKFDVGPAIAAQSPSVKSVGVTGQVTGDRADVIIGDDVEIPKNSQTEDQREKLYNICASEFESVLKPDGLNTILYLGTPHTSASLYLRFQEVGYDTRLWPARYPDKDQLEYYGNRISPLIREKALTDPRVHGKSTEPTRFSNEYLRKAEFKMGKSNFSLQFMLDCRLSDLFKFPLKLSDLVVMGLNPDQAPERVVWAKDERNVHNDLPCVGHDGDCYFGPMDIQGDWIEYTGSVLAIDPAGRGKDETAYVVLKFLNGFLYLLDAGGFRGDGYSEEVLLELMRVADKYDVNKLVVEPNFGDGMYTSLLKSFLQRTHRRKDGSEFQVRAAIEEIKAVGQKEVRIIDTIEPIMNQHRLVVDKDLILKDYDNAEGGDEKETYLYRLFYQMAYITRDRQSLAHDDRIDALALACSYFNERLKVSADKQIEKRQEEVMERELEDFIGAVTGKPYGRKRQKQTRDRKWTSVSRDKSNR